MSSSRIHEEPSLLTRAGPPWLSVQKCCHELGPWRRSLVTTLLTTRCGEKSSCETPALVNCSRKLLKNVPAICLDLESTTCIHLWLLEQRQWRIKPDSKESLNHIETLQSESSAVPYASCISACDSYIGRPIGPAGERLLQAMGTCL